MRPARFPAQNARAHQLGNGAVNIPRPEVNHQVPVSASEQVIGIQRRAGLLHVLVGDGDELLLELLDAHPHQHDIIEPPLAPPAEIKARQAQQARRGVRNRAWAPARFEQRAADLS